MTPEERIVRAWTDALVRIAPAADAARSRGMCAALLAAYAEPSRHYHDGAHIAAMLALFDRHGGLAVDPDAVTLAILYHDCVYDARRGDNEAASAAASARDLGGLGVSDELQRRVVHLIQATRHGASVPDPADGDLALLLDLDLSVLAAGPAVYDAYAAAIRREYAHVPEPLYKAGRGRVLR
jgi:predicted metal-dependent HD superfamily phosphohydrolase